MSNETQADDRGSCEHGMPLRIGCDDCTIARLDAENKAPQPAQPAEPIGVVATNPTLNTIGSAYVVRVLVGMPDAVRVGDKLYTAPPPEQQPLSQWIKTEDQMPPSGQTVLVFYLSANGLPRRVRAQWITAKSSESGSESDIGEYDEAADTYYDPEGWYEQIDNWDTYSAVGICGVTVTHWMPLPPAPAHGIGGGK